MKIDKNGAAVKFPPPLIFLLAIGTAYILNAIWPWQIFGLSYHQFISVLLFLLGGFLALSAVVALRSAHTHIEPWRPTKAIVSDGVFAWSRNPIYLAFILLTLSAAFFLNNAWIFLTVVAAVFVLYQWVIVKEERYLSEKFGDEYLLYCTRVRRWL